MRNNHAQVRWRALNCGPVPAKVQSMTQRSEPETRSGLPRKRTATLAGALLLLLASTGLAAQEPSAAAIADFDSYIGRVEARLAEQHSAAGRFLAPEDSTRLRRGELIVEQLTPGAAPICRGPCCTNGAARRSFQEPARRTLSG